MTYSIMTTVQFKRLCKKALGLPKEGVMNDLNIIILAKRLHFSPDFLSAILKGRITVPPLAESRIHEAIAKRSI